MINVVLDLKNHATLYYVQIIKYNILLNSKNRRPCLEMDFILLLIDLSIYYICCKTYLDHFRALDLIINLAILDQNVRT